MSLYVFNQYYFDLLKKVKDYTRGGQGKVQASSIRKAIKNNYGSYDKTAAEYRDFFITNTEEARNLWESSTITDIKGAKTWLANESIGVSQIYDGITLTDVDTSIRSKKDRKSVV